MAKPAASSWTPELINSYRAPERVARQALHEVAVDLATSLYNDIGYVLPMWIIASYGEKRPHPNLDGHFIVVVKTAWASPDEKYQATEMMRDFVNDADVGAYAYAFICEAWVATERKGDKYDELRKLGFPVAPADRDEADRDDILMITSFERDGDSALTRFLTHDKGGAGKSFLGPRIEMEAVDPDSRMCLFPKRETAQ